MPSKKIKVLIVDDSALVRKLLSEILSNDPLIEVIGAAGNPYFASRIIKEQIPDVITLDVEMPKMDGLTFLKILMSQKPIPVVIISSLTEKNSLTALKALELGAVEVIQKPTIKAISDPKNNSRLHLIDIVKASAEAKIKKAKKSFPIKKDTSAHPAIEHISTNQSSMIKTTEKVVVIGASTGGTEALKEILTTLPYDTPAIAIVQHMPEIFTKSFADRLNDICNIKVKEAENGDTLLRGQALIAPGNKHMLIKRSGAKYFVQLSDDEPVNRHRPSVDVLFNSAARYVGQNCIGIILTGMGKDGAKGLLTLKNSGSDTIAQDEASSVVFGMPKEAIRINAAKKVIPLKNISNAIFG
ncbi:chemotaxis response regulator protein-glutamate methylesterase [Flammeovirgaceae bacterium SG7u.111]|nr:chemotaxis response regulator protein-glutamate methylesterase [Flammeovirgaceae bacterium SG7u.132]WPO33391.1 chemotaxis response regulator protein-glutamate methylesterase [Flammeovirgaceae bacterium SG7u.111]